MPAPSETYQIYLRSDDPLLFHHRLEKMRQTLASKGGRIVRVEHGGGDRPRAVVHYTSGNAEQGSAMTHPSVDIVNGSSKEAAA